MTNLSDPLMSTEVDLRDFAFMPLDVLRLRDSDLAALASGDEFKAAVMLWCVAWHQVPAGSLPSDDRLLARYSGAGPQWRKVREQALRGFVECSDGRLYHATICEKARESWAKKLAQRDRTRKATEERERRRREAEAARDAQRDEQSHEHGDDQRDVERYEQRDVERNVVQGTGTVKGQGQGEEEKARRRAPPPRPEGVGEQTWTDWLALRKAKKAPVTPTVLAGAVTEAQKAGMTLDAFLRLWCQRGSHGLMADWIKPEEKAVNGHHEAERTAQMLREHEQHKREAPAPEVAAKLAGLVRTLRGTA